MRKAATVASEFRKKVLHKVNVTSHDSCLTIFVFAIDSRSLIFDKHDAGATLSASAGAHTQPRQAVVFKENICALSAAGDLGDAAEDGSGFLNFFL